MIPLFFSISYYIISFINVQNVLSNVVVVENLISGSVKNIIDKPLIWSQKTLLGNEIVQVRVEF